MNIAYLLLGSNKGDSRQLFFQALNDLEKEVGRIIGLSAVYETEPWGNKDQAPFLNQALCIETILKPENLLSVILAIEKKNGRTRVERWAPRTLDIDILYYNKEIIVKKDLKIPHAEMHHRNFVLIPLAEIAGDFIHPVFNISSAEMLKRCKDNLGVKKVH